MLFACSEPLLKASYHEFKAFRERILYTQEKSKSPLPNQPMAKSLLKWFSHVFPEKNTLWFTPEKGYPASHRPYF